MSTAVGMVFLCPDTPTGTWNERHQAGNQLLRAHGVNNGNKRGASVPVLRYRIAVASDSASILKDEKERGLSDPTSEDAEKGRSSGYRVT